MSDHSPACPAWSLPCPLRYLAVRWVARARQRAGGSARRMLVSSPPGVWWPSTSPPRWQGCRLVFAGGSPLPPPGPSLLGPAALTKYSPEVQAVFSLLEGFAWPRPRCLAPPTAPGRHLPGGIWHPEGTLTCRAPAPSPLTSLPQIEGQAG